MVFAELIDFFKNRETAKKQSVRINCDGGGIGRLTVLKQGKAVTNFLKWLAPVLYVFFDVVARALEYKSKTTGAKLFNPLLSPKLYIAA